MKRTAGLLVWLVVCVALAGCARKVKVTGKVTEGATPLQGADRQPLMVRFTPTDEKQRQKHPVYEATVDQKAGTYEVVVPRGQYRICIIQFTDGLQDRFENKFGEGVSPIIRDIKGSQVEDVDVTRPNG
jgi:hypothetical protein